MPRASYARCRTDAGQPMPHAPCSFGPRIEAMHAASHYVIQDPHHEYGVEFIEHIFRRHGHRAICIYTNRRERLYHEAANPSLRSRSVAAAYDLQGGITDAFVANLRSRYRVIAVIPFDETSVAPLSDLASRLGLSWAQPSVMGRFRDKFALKAHLRSGHPSIRVNQSHLVASFADVERLRQYPAYERFVLKPNDGYGNRHVCFFDHESPAASIQTYLSANSDASILMEEYIEGTEYFVNGQIDAGGRALTNAIFEYSRRPANGRDNIDFETLRVSHGTALFGRLDAYAVEVMGATGLRRSPFHLELKVDARGPCLIEAAARLPGHDNAHLSGELHGPRLSLIEMATDQYFGLTPPDPPALDWAAYDSLAVRYVHGVASRGERVYDLHGIAAVESLPEFCRWIRKPCIGPRIERTIDTLTMPWSLILKGPTEAHVAEAAARARSLIRWNTRTGALQRAALSVRFRVPRGIDRLRQWLALAAPPLAGALPGARVGRRHRGALLNIT